MEKRIKLIIEGQDRASASIQSAQRSLINFGGIGKGILSSFLAWHALRGIFSGIETVFDAVGGAIASTASAGMDFNETMSHVAAVADTDAKSLDQLRMKAMELGRDTVFTTNEAGKAIEELIKAGVSVPVVLGGAAEATVALASAGGIALDESALIISRAVNSFQLGGEKAMYAADLIANAANASATTVHNMGEAMKYAAPILQSLTSPAYDSATAIAELATANALLSQSGIDASMAGAGLQRMIEGLTPNSEKAAGIMRDLGLITEESGNRFFDAEGQFIGLKDAVLLLDESMRTLTQEEKMTAMEAMFGQRAGRVLNNLINQLGDTGEGWDNMYAAVTEDGGAVEAAAVKLDNLRGRLEFLRGSLEFIQTSIWTEEFERRLTSPFITLAEWLGRIGDRLQGWDVQSTLYVLADALAKIGEVAIDQFAPKIVAFLDDVGKEETRVALRDLATAISNLIVTLSGGKVEVDPSIENTIAMLASGQTVAAKENANELVPAITGLTTAIRNFDNAIQTYQAWNKWVSDFEATSIRWQGIAHRWVINTAASLNNDMVNAVNTFTNWEGWTRVGNIPADIQTAWNKDLASLTSWWTTNLAPILVDIDAWAQDVRDKVAELPGKMARAIAAEWQEFKDEVRNGMQGAYDVVANFSFRGAAITAGATLISGLVAGIRGGLGQVGSAVGTLASHALAVWRAATGSHSPSTVMIEEGHNLIDGVVIGVNESGEHLIARMYDLAVHGIEKYNQAIEDREEETYNHGSQIGEEYTSGVGDGVAEGERGILDEIEALWREFTSDMETRMEDFKAWMRQQGEEAGLAFSEGLSDSIKVPDLPGSGEAAPGPDDGEYGHGSQPGGPLESPWQSAPPGGSRDPWGANPVHDPRSAPPGGSRDPHPDYPGNRPATTVNVYGLGYREATDTVVQRINNDSRPVFRNEYGVL